MSSREQVASSIGTATAVLHEALTQARGLDAQEKFRHGYTIRTLQLAITDLNRTKQILVPERTQP